MRLAKVIASSMGAEFEDEDGEKEMKPVDTGVLPFNIGHENID